MSSFVAVYFRNRCSPQAREQLYSCKTVADIENIMRDFVGYVYYNTADESGYEWIQ